MSVPFCFHAVSKVRENIEKGDGFTHDNAKPAPPKQGAWFPGPVAGDLLQSYSSKMMKAIWGQYNRYSVHNFKSNQALPGALPGVLPGALPGVLPGVLAAQPQELSGAEREADSASAGGLFSH